MAWSITNNTRWVRIQIIGISSWLQIEPNIRNNQLLFRSPIAEWEPIVTAAMEVRKELRSTPIGKVKMKTIRPGSSFRRILKPYSITRFIFKEARIDHTRAVVARFSKVNYMEMLWVILIDKLLRNNNKGTPLITLPILQLRVIKYWMNLHW